MTAPWAASGRFEVGGKSLEYACHGPPPDDAPTLVLLHEGLGCVALWRDFPSRLINATGWGVFVYSRAGYGKSDWAELPRPLDYMTIEAMEVLPDVLDAIGFKNGVLVGHSDGATIAAIHAGLCDGQRVKGVILMAPHFFTEEMGLTEIAKAKTAYEAADLSVKLSKYHHDPDNAFFGWNDSWLHPDFRQWNVEAVIDQIQVPVLAIQGQQDQYGTLAQIEVIERRCPAPVEKLVLEACRHSPFLDQEAEVIDAMSRFLQRPEIAEPRS